MNSDQEESFDYFSNVESFYKRHSRVISAQEEKVSSDFGMPMEIIRDAVKRTLSEVLEGGPKDFLCISNNKVPFKYRVLYCVAMLFFLFNVFFGKKIKKTVSKKVIFDMWNVNGYNYFYQPLLKLLKKSDVLLYVTNQHKFFENTELYTANNIYSSKYLFDPRISKSVFNTQALSFNFYKCISEKVGINFIYIVLNMFRTIAMYSTHAKQVNCYVFFSACDNQFNSLRYDIYKRNGIQNIVLLQNGLRTGKWANDTVDLYTYCDYYFGFGVEQINIQKGMVCDNKMPVGSVKLHSMLNKYRGKEKEKEFDVVFLASYEEEDTPYIKVKTYEKIINNLRSFKENHPNIRIFYSDKKRENKSLKYSSMIEGLESSGIICTADNISDSYEAISYSKVALFYRTTIGLEALAMNKAVLNLNYDNDMIPMSQKDSQSVLIDSSYEKFEDRLMLLLKADKERIKSSNNKIALEYMNNANHNNLPEDILYIVFNNCSKEYGLSK